MTISVRCPHCGVVHEVGDHMAGTQAKCACGGVLTVPAVSQPQQTRAPQQPSPTTQAPSKINLQCPKCGQKHQADRSMAGTAAKCSCGTILKIPAPQAPQAPRTVQAPQTPWAAQAPQAPQQAPASGIASLLDELTEGDHERIQPTSNEPEEPLGPTEDEVLSQYTFDDTVARRRPRRSNLKRPVCTIILGILNMIGAAIFLFCGLAIAFAMIVALVQGAEIDLPVEHAAQFATLTFILICVLVFYLFLGALFLCGGIGLFAGWQYGWWFNLCLMALTPISKIMGQILLLFAEHSRVLGQVGTSLGRFKIADLVSIPLAIAIIVYLLQTGVMQYYDIQMRRWAAVTSAVVVSLVVVGLVIGTAFGLDAAVAGAAASTN